MISLIEEKLQKGNGPMSYSDDRTFRNKMMRFLINNKAMLLAALALMIASVISPAFFSFQNLRNVLRQNTTYFVLAAGFTCVISSGNIDLSAGLMTGMIGIFVGLLDTKANLPTPLIIIIAILIGAGCGFLNGFIGRLIRMPMFIVTLATGQVYKGICYMVSRNTPITGIRSSIKFLAQGYVLKQIPFAILITGIVMITIYIILNKSIFGRWAVAMGGNPETARVSGINTFWVTTGVYALLGACCAVAALVLAGRAGSAQPTAGDGMEMDAIAAVVIGGTAMSGGTAKVGGTFFGVILIGLLTNVFNLLGMDTNFQYLLKGLMILLAVTIDSAASSYFANQLKKNV